MAGLLDFLQSASNTAADTVAAPVDLLAWALRKAGVPVPQNAIGGSEWLKQQGLKRDVPQSVASLAGETVGLLSPMVAAAKAPQIAKGLLQVEANAMAPTTLRPEAGAIVWHGSPHKFDRFDASKIGTGEGAQAYGHGLYLAESPEVAKEYQRNLSSTGGAKNLANQFGNVDGAIAEAQKRIANYKEMIATGDSGIKDRAQRMLRISEKNLQDLQAMKAGLPENTGALYKVDLPDEKIARMLDWDKPLSQQSEAAQYVGRIVKRRFGDRIPEDLTGNQLYEALASIKGGQAEAAQFLKESSIPGIRYLDGGSRGAGAGTSNFVVFPGEEQFLRILERNGGLLGP